MLSLKEYKWLYFLLCLEYFLLVLFYKSRTLVHTLFWKLDAQACNTHCTGSATNPQEQVKWGRWLYKLVSEMLNFSIVTGCRLMTIFVCCICCILGGGAWGLLGLILDIKGGTEWSYMLPLSEVQWSFSELEVFTELWAPSSSAFTNYMLIEVPLSLLQRSSK